MATGEGELKFPSGGFYRGQFKNYLFEGQGQLQLINGNIYEGQFSQNKL